MANPTESADHGELRLEGVGLSPGIAGGQVIVRGKSVEEPLPAHVEDEGVESEISHLREAVARVSAQLSEIAANMEATHGQDESRIFEAHQMLLEDESVLKSVEDRIREEQLSASYLYHSVMVGHADKLRQVEDKYLSERASDIEDVAGRVVRDLAGQERRDNAPATPHVLVSSELHPSDTAEMDATIVLAFATEHGSRNSHVAIIARSLGIPAVAGIANLAHQLHSGDEVLVDGHRGLVVVRPSESTRAEFSEIAAARKSLADEFHQAREEKCVTLDGRRVVVSANIELKRELDAVKPCGARGIGLYRTEFLFLDQGAPDEEYQTAYYRRVFENVAPERVIFRTVDLGGDKTEPIAGFVEPNPFLGWRGIRYSLDREDAFRIQLRAILRGAAGMDAGIMFPLISTVEEVRRSREILAVCQAELQEEGVQEPASLEVGAMIEVPSAALMADAIAREVDFLSIGTNDLIQYTTAVDRINDRVADRFQPFHPAVVKLIIATADAGKRAGIWTGVCGEMASDVLALPILLGAGVQELSMVTTAVPGAKFAVRRLHSDRCAEWLREGMEQWTVAAEVEEAARGLAHKAYPELVDA